MKILFVGDPHFSSEQIPIRTDNYPETVLHKAEQTLELARKHAVDLYVLSGDFCHTKRFSVTYFNKLVSLFASYPDIRKSCCIGNHDLTWGKPETIERSFLGSMFVSGLFEPRIGECSIETPDTFVLFVPYSVDGCPPVYVQQGNKKTVLVSHYLYNLPGFPDNLPMEYTEHFDYILLGHDHTPYPTTKCNKATVVRPGSLTRGSRDQTQLDREVHVALINTEADTVEYIPLQIRPSNEVFNITRLNRERSLKSNSGLVGELSSTISVSENVNIVNLFNSLDLEDLVRENSLRWLRQGGLI